MRAFVTSGAGFIDRKWLVPRLRWLTFASGLLLVLGAEAVLNATRWLGLSKDPFAFLSPGERIIPVFEDPRYGLHFGPALVILVLGLALVFLALWRLPGGTAADTVRRLDVKPLEVVPLTVALPSSKWRKVAAASLVLAVGSVAWYAWSMRRGPPPNSIAFIASLVTAGGAFHAIDRARGRRLFSRDELLGAGAYPVFLLLLGYGNRRAETVLPTLVLGLALFGVLHWKRALSSEWIAFGVMALLGFAVYSTHIVSWRYTFIGDEYAYFGFAKSLVHTPFAKLPQLFGMKGVYGQAPILSGYVQAFTMRLYGEDQYGWRISESLSVFLAALPIYALVRAFARRRAALVAVLVFLSSQHLLGFSRAGYAHCQALLTWPAAVALLLLAARRGSLLGLFLAGVSACWAFYTMAVAIPLIGVPGLFFIFMFLSPGNPAPRLRSMIPATLAFSAGLLLTAAPGFLDIDWFKSIVGQTAAKSQVATAHPFLEQILPNYLFTQTAVLHFPIDSHYVSGAHLDPVSSSLMMLGLLTALGLSFSRRAAAANRVAIVLLLSFPIICFCIGGLGPYGLPSIPRTYIVVPFYAVFAALGAARVVAGANALGMPRRLVAILAVPVLALIPLANLYNFLVLMEKNKSRTAITMMIRQFEGMPDETPFAFVSAMNKTIRQVVESTRYPVDKLIFIPDLEPRQAMLSLQRRYKTSVVVLLPGDPPVAHLDAWIAAFTELWPGRQTVVVQDGEGIPHLTQLVLPPRPATLRPPESVLHTGDLPRVVGGLRISAPRDVVLAPDGDLWVLTDDAIEVLDRDGNRMRRIPHTLRAPLALAFDGGGQALVLDSAEPSRLLRLRLDGTAQVAARLDLLGLPSVRGFAIGPSGELVVADPAAGRVVRLAPDLSAVVADVKTGGDALGQPTTVGFVGGHLVVGDLFFTYVMDEKGNQVLAKWKAIAHGTSDPPRILPAQRDLVVISNPDGGGITVYDLAGRLLQDVGPPVYSTLRRGQGLAGTPHGLVFVTEYEDDSVRIYDWAKP